MQQMLQPSICTSSQVVKSTASRKRGLIPLALCACIHIELTYASFCTPFCTPHTRAQPVQIDDKHQVLALEHALSVAVSRKHGLAISFDD